MNRTLIASLSFVVALAATAAPAGNGASFLLKNVTVHPVSGSKLDNASVLVVDGRIAEVGTKVSAPKVRVIDGKGLHVWPGMINSGATVGLAEIGSVRESNDTGELGAFDPQLRPIVAVNPASEYIPVVRANGITMVALLPATPGERRSDGANAQIIRGQISLAHLAGWTWEEMEVRRAGGLHLSYPAISAVSFDPATFSSSRRGNAYPKAKQLHDAQVQELTGFFDDARAYWTAKKAGVVVKADLKFEAMGPVLNGAVPLIAFASREREIKEAIEFAEKQNVRLVLAGVRKPGATLEQIAKKKIPVILGRTQVETDEEDDPYDEPYALPAKLNEAGVKFCFGTFDEQFARNLPYQASQGVPFGLPYDAALRSVTLSAAEIWGIDKDYGSIEKGKVADLVVTDGDLLEVKTNVKMLFIRGSEVDLETRHTLLYKKYMARP